jgi:ribonuclease P protein component
MVFAPGCAPSEAGGYSTPGVPKDATASAPREQASPARYPRSHRVRRRREFGRLLRQGRRVHCGPLEARFARSFLSHARLGLIVGRRAAARAVARNRLKRLLRESFRTRSATLPALDVVFRVTRSPSGEAEFREALEGAWRRILHETRG